MLPLVGGDGIRAVLHCICLEAAAAGIEQIGVIVSPGQEETCRRYFAAARDSEAQDLPVDIEYIVQPTPAGFGEAVLRGAEFVGADAPGFLMMLGDHVHAVARNRPSCAAQVTRAFAERPGAAMIGMQPVGPEELPRVGVAGGEPVGGRVYRCTDFVEKPALQVARQRLVTAELPSDRFLAHCGAYAFTPEIFECLSDLAASGAAAGEIQLADAQSMLLKRHRQDYYLLHVEGRAWDVGTPRGYAEAFVATRDARSAGPAIRKEAP